MKKLQKTVAATATIAGALWAGMAMGHGIWFAQRSDALALVYGVGADDLDTVKRFEKMVSLIGYDEEWNEVDAELIKAGPMVLVGGDDYPLAVSGVMNNGVWSKTPDGKWHAAGHDEVPDAVISERTMKYAVHLRGPLREIPKLPTQTLQIIPVDGAPGWKEGTYNLHGTVTPRQAGDVVRVQVLYKGIPVAGARVVRDWVNDPDQQPWLTGEDGTVYFPVRNQGLNVIGATYDGPTDMPKVYSRIEHFATLSFVLDHLPE